MPIIDYKIDTYSYFNNLNGSILTNKVLDYGCNYGVFLESAKNFEESNYTGLDVDLEAIIYGRKLFPKATFIHYDRHNYCYNPAGNLDLWPIIEQEFDYIISYSVLTHTTKEDMLEAIKWLYSKLKMNGKMFISFLDINNNIAKKYFYNKRIKDFGNCDKILTDDFIYLVDNKVTKIPSKGKFFLSFYHCTYLTSLLSNYNFELKKTNSNIGGCFQDCIIIKK